MRKPTSQPSTFYFGSVGGGVWKTVNAGRTWFPIADEGIPIGSIGALPVRLRVMPARPQELSQPLPLRPLECRVRAGKAPLS